MVRFDKHRRNYRGAISVAYFNRQLYIFVTGSLTVKVLPPPGSLDTSIVPRWSSIILWVRAIPRPTPLSLVVKKGLKIFLVVFSSIPIPLSLKVIFTVVRAGSFSERIERAPPFGMA